MLDTWNTFLKIPHIEVCEGGTYIFFVYVRLKNYSVFFLFQCLSDRSWVGIVMCFWVPHLIFLILSFIYFILFSLVCFWTFLFSRNSSRILLSGVPSFSHFSVLISYCLYFIGFLLENYCFHFCLSACSKIVCSIWILLSFSFFPFLIFFSLLENVCFYFSLSNVLMLKSFFFC